jgi:hypothetical protein
MYEENAALGTETFSFENPRREGEFVEEGVDASDGGDKDDDSGDDEDGPPVPPPKRDGVFSDETLRNADFLCGVARSSFDSFDSFDFFSMSILDDSVGASVSVGDFVGVFLAPTNVRV